MVVHHQRRVTDEMGAPELTLNGTIPLVLSFARRTSVLAFRVLLWRHIRRYVIRRDTEDEAELLKALPVRRARRRKCCGLRSVVMWLGGEGTRGVGVEREKCSFFVLACWSGLALFPCLTAIDGARHALSSAPTTLPVGSC